MKTNIAKNEKITDHDKKLITFTIDHLNKRPLIELRGGRRPVETISFDHVHSVYRSWANKHIEKGYSVIFVHGKEKKILQYNTQPKDL